MVLAGNRGAYIHENRFFLKRFMMPELLGGEELGALDDLKAPCLSRIYDTDPHLQRGPKCSSRSF